jgi:hypothetical protein
MITTQVQRTLVKSPPELWTELSDPASLARHLEGLGEIEITAVEPETRIEWRAADATGTVALNASGWGTKVTLTVTRELDRGSAGEPPAAGDASTAGEPCDAGEPSNAGEPSTAGELSDAGARAAGEQAEPGEPEDPTAGRPQPAAAVDSAGTPRHEPDAEREDPGQTFAEEAPPPPLTAAARFAPHHPAPLLRDTADPGHDQDGAVGEEAALDHGAALVGDVAWPGVAAEDPAPPPADDPPEPTRRGFFARLFGRRRRQVSVYGQLEPFAAEPGEQDALEIDTGESAEDHAEELDPYAFAPQAQAFDADASVVDVDAPAAVLQPEPEPGFAPEPEPEPEPEATFVPGPDPDPAPPAGGGSLRAAAQAIAEAFPLPPAEPGAAATPALAGETPTAAEAPGGDLATELRAAEEAVAAEVEAVLTGVLDRLGAAHHRPFSRA